MIRTATVYRPTVSITGLRSEQLLASKLSNPQRALASATNGALGDPGWSQSTSTVTDWSVVDRVVELTEEVVERQRAAAGDARIAVRAQQDPAVRAGGLDLRNLRTG